MRTSISVTIAHLMLLLVGCLACTTVDAGGIYRVNLDGSGTTDLVTDEVGGVSDLALDVGGGQMYWTNTVGKIRRANLDGSEVTDLVTDFIRPGSIALDLDAGHIYFFSGGPIPEPSALTLAALGLVGLVIAGLRRRG